MKFVPAAFDTPTIGGRPKSFWTSLSYFSLYRLIVASVFFFATLFYGRSLNLGADSPLLFGWVAMIYWLLAIFFYAGLNKLKLGFNTQLTLQVVIDIVALTLMMYASGGSKSGLAIMLMVVLAGAGLVGQGRLTVFFAALATLAVLIEQGYRVLASNGESADFVQTGIISIGFFATAISARLLAQRVIYNEQLARQRGIDLANQLSVGQRIIRDMHDGVIVADAGGLVRQFNPQAEALLGARPPPQSDLAVLCARLAEFFDQLPTRSGEVVRMLEPPAAAKSLRVRFVRASEGGDVLIYLEDLERIHKEAQQFKLAALGRLTANMAHEIRNPLSAVSHAAELLREERRADMQARLARIIIDNSARLERLVRDVLELGRRVNADPEPIRLMQFLDAFAEELAIREQVEREVCAMEVPPDAALLFDRVHLNQVLGNLLGNALRYSTRRPGSVRLIAVDDPSMERTELHIIDDGPGIPTASSGQVFEPFFTTHNQGTGLGLYIARELCEANGATLELIEDEAGAHFRISGRSCEQWGDRKDEAAEQ